MIPRDWQAEGVDRAVGITPATGARRANPKDEAMRSATIASQQATGWNDSYDESPSLWVYSEGLFVLWG